MCRAGLAVPDFLSFVRVEHLSYYVDVTRIGMEHHSLVDMLPSGNARQPALAASLAVPCSMGMQRSRPSKESCQRLQVTPVPQLFVSEGCSANMAERPIPSLHKSH